MVAMTTFVKESEQLDDMLPYPKEPPRGPFKESLVSSSVKKAVLLGVNRPDDDDFESASNIAILDNYREKYLNAWGLDDIDKGFVDKHGSSMSGPKKTELLLRVLESFREFST